MTNREEDPSAAPDPFDLMAQAATEALAGAGVDVAVGRHQPLLDGPLAVAAPRRSRPRPRRPARDQGGRDPLLGHGREHPPVAREPGRRAGGGGWPTAGAHHRGRGARHPQAGQEGGRRARLAVSAGVARDVARPGTRHGGPSGGEGARPRGRHHHVRAGGDGAGPRPGP